MTVQTLDVGQIRETWNDLAPQFDHFTAEWSMPLGEHVLRQIGLRPGVQFLDVACGSGALAIPAARRGAAVTAVDLAPGMIERLSARAKADGLLNLSGQVMAGEALEFPADRFDICASQNGVSTFRNLAGGLRELVRVAKPGGRVVIVAFGSPQRTEILAYFISAVQACVPHVTPLALDPPALPFQLAVPARLGAVLSDVGLDDVEVETITWDKAFASGTHFWDVVTAGMPIAVQLAARLTERQRADVQHVLDAMFRERSGGKPGATLRSEVNVGIGTK